MSTDLTSYLTVNSGQALKVPFPQILRGSGASGVRAEGRRRVVLRTEQMPVARGRPARQDPQPARDAQQEVNTPLLSLPLHADSIKKLIIRHWTRLDL